MSSEIRITVAVLSVPGYAFPMPASCPDYTSGAYCRQVTIQKILAPSIRRAYGAPMKLADWLEWKAVDQTEFASRIGVTQSTVSRYVSGALSPKPAVVRKILEQTGGEVRPIDLLPPVAEDTSRG